MKKTLFACTIILLLQSGVARNTVDPSANQTIDLLFICNGNYYRSRFAEAYLKFLTERLNLPLTVISRGVKSYAHKGENVSPPVLRELMRRGIPAHYAEGVPMQLTSEDLQHAKRIIAMSRGEQGPAIKQIGAGHPLLNIEYWEIADDASACSKLAWRIDDLVGKLRVQRAMRLRPPE